MQARYYAITLSSNLPIQWHIAVCPVPGPAAFKPNFSNLRRTVHILNTERLELISCLHRRQGTIRHVQT